MKTTHGRTASWRFGVSFWRFVVLIGLLASGGVEAGAASRLVNISARTQVGGGDNVLIAGFVVSGAGTRSVLVRSVGPTLGEAPYFVPGTLSDPRLRLYDSSSVQIEENEDWGGTPMLKSTFSSLGAFPIPDHSKDAALVHDYSAGAYTCICDGRSGQGEALLEVYDSVEPGSEGQALSNLSLRGPLADGGTLIAGFVIAGDRPKTVLIRGAGPSLADFGVSPAHPNPKITLYQAQTVVATNTDWHQAANADAIAATGRRFWAFPFAASGKDAALLVTLSPGLYTVYLEGEEAGQSGVVLVELYDADIEGPTTPPNPPLMDPSLAVLSVEGTSGTIREGASGHFTLTRKGGGDERLTVMLSIAGTAVSGSDYNTLPSEIEFPAGVRSVVVPVQSLQDSNVEAPESVELSIVAGEAYQAQSWGSHAALLIEDATAMESGWRASYFSNRTFSGEPSLVRVDPEINFDWGGAAPAEGVPADKFTVRWEGLISVDIAQVYTFVADADDGVWVWVDDLPVIKRPDHFWYPISGSVYLDSGVRHKVRVEFKENWGNADITLSWFAAGMLKQLVPLKAVKNAVALPAQVVGPRQVAAVAGAPFSLQMTGIGVVGDYQASGLPSGLGIDPRFGLISGVFALPGDYELVVSAANEVGQGSARVVVHVVETDGEADTALWALTSAGALEPPAGAAPLSAGTVKTLLGPGEASTAFLRRIHGFITAPKDGLYSFWVRGAGRCQFWLADSEQLADRMLRCSAQDAVGWNDAPGQRSEAVYLKAGSLYSFELLQSAFGAAQDNVQVGWVTPGGVSAYPFETVPGTLLSRHKDVQASDGGTIFVAALRPASEVSSPGSGIVSLALSSDAQSALVSAQFTGISSNITSVRLLLYPETINETRLLRLTGTTSAPIPWIPTAVGALSREDVLQALRAGEVTVRVETARNPAGELRGQLQPTGSSVLFVPPAEPAPLPGGALSAAEASRFLRQATMGPTLEAISHLQSVGYARWFEEQWALPPSNTIEFIDQARAAAKLEDPNADVWSNTFVSAWWNNAVTKPDQLRQRVAFALSEIYVVSMDSGVHLDACSSYYDLLLRFADGHHRDLVEAITLHPAMAQYLSMLRNQKPDLAKGQYPDENYARELMQLFSIGLNKLHPDGTLKLDTSGLPLPTYDQEAIVGMAHVLTGWTYDSESPDASFLWGPPEYRKPLRLYQNYHDTAPKRIIEGVVLPEGRGGLTDLRSALEVLHRHPNTGPFLAKQLIQRLVSSNPSPAYVYRVARVFDDNGAGVRGDLKAVVRAVLMDPEARREPDPEDVTRGKLREPLLRITQLWRAFGARPAGGIFTYAWFRDDIGQEPLNSPTVFNFFRPNYVPSGPLSSAGLLAPEFQITTETQVGKMANVFEYFTSDWGESSPEKVRLDLSLCRTEYAKGADPFLDLLGLLLLDGAMSTELRTQLNGMMADFPNWLSTDDRIRELIHVVLCSPDFVVER